MNNLLYNKKVLATIWIGSIILFFSPQPGNFALEATGYNFFPFLMLMTGTASFILLIRARRNISGQQTQTKKEPNYAFIVLLILAIGLSLMLPFLLFALAAWLSGGR